MTDSKMPESKPAAKKETAAPKSTLKAESAPTAVKAGGDQSKKIIMIVAVLLGLCVLCSILGFIGSRLLNKAGDKVADKAKDSIEDRIEDDIENDGDDDTDSDIDFGGNAKLPEGWPSEIKLYNGSKITTSSRTKSSDGDGYNYSLIGSVPDTKQEDVVNHFKDMMQDLGWELESENTFFGQTLTYKKGNDEFTVNLSAYTGNDVAFIIGFDDKN